MALTPDEDAIRRIDELEMRIDTYIGYKWPLNTSVPTRFEFRLEQGESPLSPEAFAELRRRYARWEIRQNSERNELLFDLPSNLAHGYDSPVNSGADESARARPSARLTLIVVSAAAYIGLAVLGWGGDAASFFSHPPLIALTAVLFVLVGVSFFAGGNISPGVREDRGNRWVLAAFAVIGLLNAWLPAYTDRKDFWTIDGDTIRWLGVFLFAAGGALRIWPVFVLGNRFSGLVAIQPGHTLVTTGIYSVIRHPSYLGLLVNSLGWGLAFRAGAGVLLTALIIPPLLARIHAEEKLLREQFGNEYSNYCARTSRLLPGVY